MFSPHQSECEALALTVQLAIHGCRLTRINGIDRLMASIISLYSGTYSSQFPEKAPDFDLLLPPCSAAMN